MSKVNDFCIVSELGILVTASSDKFLRVFKIEIKNEFDAGSVAEIGQIQLISTTSFQKESTQRGIQCDYDTKRHLLLVLSADNQLEVFKVNISKPETILKKLVRAEKKKALKRTHKQLEQQAESGEEDAAPIKRSVDKAALQKSIDDRDYNMALHFTRRVTVPLDPTSKARAFTCLKS